MKQPLKETLKRIGGGHLLNEDSRRRGHYLTVEEYSDELGIYILGLRPKIAGLKFNLDRMTGSWEWTSGDVVIYATYGWMGKHEVPIEPIEQDVVKTLKYKHSGDLKKDAKWYISNMKRYLPGILKDLK